MSLEDAGYLVASRYNGKLHLGKRASDWGAVGDVTDFWLGSAVGMPLLLERERDRRAVVLFPMAGTPSAYGLSFPVEGAPPKPAAIDLVDLDLPSMPRWTHPEWTATTGALTSNGGVLMAFILGEGAAGQARFALLDGALKPQGPLFQPLGADGENVSDIKVAVLPDDRIVVATSSVLPGAGRVAVEAAVMRCGATPDAH